MGTRGILFRDYDWMGITFSTNENSGDNPVFSRSQLVATVNSDSSCVAILMEVLMKGEATEFLALLGSDAKEVMLIDKCRSESWGKVRFNVNKSVWGRWGPEPEGSNAVRDGECSLPV